MADEHPNVSLMKKLDLGNLDAAGGLFADDFVWHYINPNLPDIEGDYVGLAGLQTFFQTLGARMKGTFQVEPISVTPCGDELIVVHVKNVMTLEGQPISLHAVVVWRIVGGRIAEAWDIPSAHTVARAA